MGLLMKYSYIESTNGSNDKYGCMEVHEKMMIIDELCLTKTHNSLYDWLGVSSGRVRRHVGDCPAWVFSPMC